MADGLVLAENRKGSGMTTGIMEAASVRARTLLVDTDLTFCQLRLLGHLCSTLVAKLFGWLQLLRIL